MPNANVVVWRSGNGVRHINEVKLRRARLVLGLVTTFGGYTVPGIYSGHPGSLAIPQWVGSVSIPEMFSAISGKKRRLRSYDLVALYKSVYKYE